MEQQVDNYSARRNQPRLSFNGRANARRTGLRNQRLAAKTPARAVELAAHKDWWIKEQ